MHTAEAREHVFGREAVILGALVALLVGLALAFGAARSGSSYLFNSDAIYFKRVAMDPFGRGHSFAGLPADVGVAYRYGRILYPAVAWLLAAGRPSLVVWTMPAVYSASIGVMVASACALTAGRGRPPLRGLWVLLVPSMWVTIPIVFSDPVMVAMILLVYRLAQAGRPRAARVAASFMLLAREATGLALLPLLLADSRRQGARSLGGWLAVPVPLIAWWAWVRVRIGVWPPLDPAYGRRGALSYPLGGVIQVIREGKPMQGWFLVAIALGIVTVVAGVVVSIRFPWAPISQGAILSCLLVVCLGPSAVRLPAQMVRLMLPAQVLIVLTLAGRDPRQLGASA